jgi:hypothetical protein
VKEGEIAAALCTVVVDEPLALAAPRVLRWALAVWAAGADEVPLAVVHDLGFVLLRGRGTRFCASRDRALGAERGAGGESEAAALRAARIAFEDRVVAPWLNDPALLAAHVVIAGLPAVAQELAIPHAIFLALTRGLPAGSFPAQNVGALRTSQQQIMGDKAFDDEADLVARAGAGIAAAAAVLDVARTVLAARPLLKEEDLWELSHLDDVPSEAARLALRTVHRIAARIGPPSSSTLSRLQRRSRDVPIDDEESSAFPAGGFDAMSTKGTFENLVRSEVAYVGEGRSIDAAGSAFGPDLFDVRFVEGELLYYTRDETPLLEQRRALVFVVTEVERLRFKLKELPSQTLVLVLACCLRAHTDLTLGLGPLAVHSTFAIGGTDAAIVAEEQGLLQSSLMADLAHRRVAIVDEASAPPPGRIVFSPRPAPAKSKDTVPPRAWVRVGGARWSVKAGDESFSVDASDLVALREFVDRLLLLS